MTIRLKGYRAMEIGSIFEIDPKSLFNEPQVGCSTFPFEGNNKWSFSYFNTGRAAIEALLVYLKGQGKRKVWLPGYNCSSVLDSAKRAGIDIELYEVDRGLNIDSSVFGKLQRSDILYLVNFFGKPELHNTLELVRAAQKKNIVIVEDLTLGLLSKGENVGFGDYLIGSVRKWLPITDGGFVASLNPLPDFKKEQAANDYTFYYFAAQIMKDSYLKDTTLDKQQFLDISNEGMKALFSDYTIREMSKVAKKVTYATDLNKVAFERYENYKYLYRLLSEISELRLMVAPVDGMVPLGMVICVEDRDDLFKCLIQNNIYCNIHWRENESTKLFQDADYLSKHCLTIPCDQRYNHEHMDYICNTIKRYYHYV